MYSQLKKYYTGAALNGGWAMPDLINSPTLPTVVQLTDLGAEIIFKQTDAVANKLESAQAKTGASGQEVSLCVGLLYLIDSYTLQAATGRTWDEKQLSMERAKALKNAYVGVTGSTIYKKIRSIFHNNKSSVVALANDPSDYAPFSSGVLPSISKYYTYKDGNRKMRIARGTEWSIPQSIRERHDLNKARRTQRLREWWAKIPRTEKAPKIRGIEAFNPAWASLLSSVPELVPVRQLVAAQPGSPEVVVMTPPSVGGTPPSVGGTPFQPPMTDAAVPPGIFRPAPDTNY